MLVSTMAVSSTALRAAEKPLRISLPPLQDSVPLAYGLAQKVFEDLAVPVELIGLSKSAERNAAILSGQLDGFLGDITTLLLLRQARSDVVTTGTALDVQSPDRGLVLLTHKFARVKSLPELLTAVPAKPIALIRISDMEYAADQLIKSTGIRVDENRVYSDFQNFENLQRIAELLGAGSGNVPAAVLPEPLATVTEVVASSNGIEILTLSSFVDIDLPPSVFIFRKAVLEERGPQVERFYKGYRQCVDLVNASAYGAVVDTMIGMALSLFYPGVKREEIRLPVGYEQKFRIPKFSLPRPLTRTEFDALLHWGLGKRYLRDRIAYESAVDGRFSG